MELSTVLKSLKTKELNRGDKAVYVNASSIIFTDKPAPYGMEVHDVSEAQDGGVVAWEESGTYYISTQRPGIKVVAPQNCCFLFFYCSAMETFDGTMLDVSHVEEMNYMFYGCKSLKNVDSLQDWNVSNVKRMANLFGDCTSLENVNGLANWDVSNATYICGMFENCLSLESIDSLASWNVSKAGLWISSMFAGCRSLKNVDSLSNWDVSNVKNMDGMFYRCSNLTTVPSWFHNSNGWSNCL
jgi:surface protein